MILDKELEKEMRKYLEGHEMVHCINLIYEYLTPQGILTNNIKQDLTSECHAISVG